MSVGTWTVPFKFSPSVDSETSRAIAGTLSWTGVDRTANCCGAFAGEVVVVLPGDVGVGRCVVGVDDVDLGVDAGPASGCS
jgi:hypothetical protein